MFGIEYRLTAVEANHTAFHSKQSDRQPKDMGKLKECMCVFTKAAPSGSFCSCLTNSYKAKKRSTSLISHTDFHPGREKSYADVKRY